MRIMDELKMHVDRLFSKYKGSSSVDDLKAEILSNLEAKKNDLLSSGMGEEAATKTAKGSITSIDALIDGNRKVRSYPYKIEKLQTILLILIVAWIFSTPFLLLQNFATNALLFLSIGVFGLTLIIKSRRKPDQDTREYDHININSLARRAKLAWIIWTAFMVLCILAITGLNFSSNFWFSRPLIIDGPYQLARLISQYIGPAFTIVIPLILAKLSKLWIKHEVIEDE